MTETRAVTLMSLNGAFCAVLAVPSVRPLPKFIGFKGQVFMRSLHHVTADTYVEIFFEDVSASAVAVLDQKCYDALKTNPYTHCIDCGKEYIFDEACTKCGFPHPSDTGPDFDRLAEAEAAWDAAHNTV